MPKAGKYSKDVAANVAAKRAANQANVVEQKAARQAVKALGGRPRPVGGRPKPNLTSVDAKPWVRPRPTPSFRPTPGPMPSPGGSVGPAKPKGPTEGYPEKPQGGGNKNYKGQRRTPPTYDY